MFSWFSGGAVRRNDVKLEVFYDGAWHDLVVADYVLAGQSIVITRGDGAESAAPRPASLACALNNDEDLFRVSNPMSPLYGKIGRNIPIRVKNHDITRVHVLASSWKTTESKAYRAADDRRGRPKTGTAAVDVEGGGLLQQIGQWKDTLQSAIVRDTERLAPSAVGFWPLEDASGAASASPGFPGLRPATVSGDVTFGDDDCPGGAATATTLGADGQLSGTFASSTTAGYQLVFSMRVPATLTATSRAVFNWYDSYGRHTTWEINDTNYAWTVRDSDTGAIINTFTTTRGAIDATNWVRARVRATATGGTITVEVSWYQENDPSGLNTSYTYAGTSAGTLTRWNILANAYTNGASYCAVTATSDTGIELQTGSARAAFNGWAGDTPSDRFVRLMSEKGLEYNVVGLDTTLKMGAQRPDTLANLLREARDTEDGLMFDTADEASVTFMTRRARYNRTAVRIRVDELPMRPAEVTDDLGVYNIVTAKNRAGEEAIAEDSTGPVGSAALPDGIGPYEQTVDVNVQYPRDLDAYANWWLRRGTVELPRYPSVEVNLAVLDPDRAEEIAALDVGDVLEISGYRENVIRLNITGYTETIGWPNEWRIVFTTFPDQQFQVGTYSETSRYDSSSSILASSTQVGATFVPIQTTLLSDCWSTTAVPYEWEIAGERMMVTSITSPVDAGAFYTQNATVIRSTNGVRKRLPSSSRVGLATPARYAL